MTACILGRVTNIAVCTTGDAIAVHGRGLRLHLPWRLHSPEHPHSRRLQLVHIVGHASP
jgi:hypothetical protein